MAETPLDNTVQLATPQEITNDDFLSPSRDILLPTLPSNALQAMGCNAKPVLIKQSILEKNKNHHPELSTDDSRRILTNALYCPNLVGQSQAHSRPFYWLTIQTGTKKNDIVVVDVYHTKETVEVIGWRSIGARSFKQLKRQSEREGGQFLILSPTPASGLAAGLSTLPSDTRLSVTNSPTSSTNSETNDGAKVEKNYEFAKDFAKRFAEIRKKNAASLPKPLNNNDLSTGKSM
jgi:hypothetical protein